MLVQIRKIGGAKHDGIGLGIRFPQDDIAALIVIYDARLHAAAAGSGRRIHVGDKTNCRLLAGERCVDVAMFRVVIGLYAHIAQLAVEKPREVMLLVSGGLRYGFLVGLGVNRCISE